jgi:hypothetical protein
VILDLKFVLRGRFHSYSMVALIAALTLVTPLQWRRRWRALLIGVLLCTLLALIRTVVSVFAVDVDQFPSAFGLDPSWRWLLIRLGRYSSSEPTLNIIVPALCWYFLAFRKSPPGEHLSRWLQDRFESSATHTSGRS